MVPASARLSAPHPRPLRRQGPGHRVWREAQAHALARSTSVEPLRLVGGLVLAADLLVVAASGAGAALLRFGGGPVPPGLPAAVVFAMLLMLRLSRFEALPAQGSGDHGAGVLLRRGLAGMSRAWCVTLAVLLLAAFLTRTSTDFARLWAAIWFALALAGMAAIRVLAVGCVRRWRRSGRLARIVAVVDLDGTGAAVARRLRERPPEEVRVIGVFAAGEAAPPRRGVEDLLALSARFRIDDVLVACSGAGGAATEALGRLSTIPTTVRLCPALPALGALVRPEAEMLLDAPTVVVCRRPLAGWHAVLKRAEDLVIGALALALLALPMLLIALAVRLDSPGPSLFRQRRMGFNNNPFTVLKFRTMGVGAAPAGDGTLAQASRGDARVTRLGRLLRRTSLDELPQLLNVLRGDMSLVGPRPHAVEHNLQYAPLIDGYLGRHRVQPGITGWAQVNGLRGETDTLDKMQRRVALDLAYVERWSLAFDLLILLRTALGVLFQPAY